MRTLYRTTEFDEFYNSQTDKTKTKLDYAMKVVADIKVLNTKLVKKLIDSDFYELRISVGNEYRVILFTIDKANIMEAEEILLLNGFMKKSTKDYKAEIEKAERILEKYSK